MSTRSQVQVKQSGMPDWDDRITLYHHSDGYPEYMLPLIKKTYDDIKSADIYALNPNMKELYKTNPTYNYWQLGRTGKVASFLCAEDPGSFEPESAHELHGDIEWYYIIECVNTHGGSCAENPTWKIHISDMESVDANGVPVFIDVIDVSEVEGWLKKRADENGE